MSRLSRHEVSVFLYPDRVALQRTERRFTLRGYARTVRARIVNRCASPLAGQRPWRGAMDRLAADLPAFIRRDARVSVILSNKFMHYTLIPWYDDLSDEEDLAMARHRFREMCGNGADSFSIRVSPGPPGAASLAAAVDQGLLEDLRGVMAQVTRRVASIQPHLMVAYNSCRSGLEGRSAWVALMEPNSLCLGALEKGQFVWIRQVRIGDAWREELPDLLERESYLADTDVQMDEVMLWAPHLADDEMPANGRWRLHRLIPQQSFVPEPQVSDTALAQHTGA